MRDSTRLEQSEAAFEQLGALLARLPHMEEAARQLARSREAAEVLALRERMNALGQEFAYFQKIYSEAATEAEAARASENSLAEGNALGIQRAYGELLAVRTAPYERAKKAYQDALASSSFGGDAELDAQVLSAEASSALEQQIAVFQQEYQQAYELCKALEEEQE